MQSAISPERVEQVFAWIERIGSDAQAFASEQAPLVVEEILRWYVAGPWLGAVVSIVIAAMLVALYWTVAKVGPDCEERDALITVSAVLFVSAMAAAGIFTVVAAHNTVKANVAPRIVVLDWATDKLNGR